MKVVVIGAGVAGLGIGWRLAQSGASVTVLERAHVGAGAASASAGMLAAGAEFAEEKTSLAALARHARALWPGFAAELEEQSGVNIAFMRNGSLLVRLKGEEPFPAASGVVSADEARAKFPSLSEDVASAMWLPDEAVVDSQALCRALAVAFVRAGGEVRSNEAAMRIESENGCAAAVVTPFRAYRADSIVLATGAWMSRLETVPPVLPPLVPVKGEILVLDPPAGAALPEATLWGNGIYLTPRGRHLLLGATVEKAGFDTALTPDALAWLRHRGEGLMPALAAWNLSGHWAGLRPAAPDLLPVLGETAMKGLYVAGGQYRNGILLAPAVAEGLSRLVMGRQALEPAFAPGRFKGTKGEASVGETPHKGAEWRTGY